MTKTHIEILKEIGEERKKFFLNYKKYSSEIKNKAKQLLGEVKVLVFGSVIKNSYNIVNSDIDILIISDNLSEKDREKIKAEIKSVLPLFNPFQIHLTTKKEYENWYKNFIKDDFIEI